MRDPLVAGVGRTCITPPFDIPNGWWRAQKHLRAKALDLDLYATALVLGQGETRVAIIEMDLCILFDEQDEAIRLAAAKASGIPVEFIWPICTHNHAAPQTQPYYTADGKEVVEEYVESLPGLIARAVEEALTSSRQVRIAAGTGKSTIGVNRDWPAPDGRIACGPNPEGFMDPEVGVWRVDDLAGNPVASIVNYACHPITLGPGNVHITPDYPGHTRATVEAVTGATCLFLQGAGGNVAPVESFQSEPRAARRLGQILGCEAARVFSELRTHPVEARFDGVVTSGAPLAMWSYLPQDVATQQLRVISRELPLHVRDPLPPIYENSEEDVTNWELILAERLQRGAGKAEVNEAVQFLTFAKLRRARARKFKSAGSYGVEMHALAVDDIALFTMWGEPYSEIGVKVKAESPFDRTLFTGYLGGEGGLYICTPETFGENPPFENLHCPFTEYGADEVARGALELLHDLAALTLPS